MRLSSAVIFFWLAAGVAWGQAPPSSGPTSAPAPLFDLCGDGVLNRGEECDQGARNSNTRPNACRKSCKLPYCGDGVVDTGEDCDDGNNVGGDACPASCVRRHLEGEEPTPKPAPKPETPAAELDPHRAFELAVGVTFFGPPGLGVIWGPAAGHFYAGEYKHAITTSGFRLAGAVAVFLAARGVARGDLSLGAGAGIEITSGLLISTLALYDILDAEAAVRRHLAP